MSFLHDALDFIARDEFPAPEVEYTAADFARTRELAFELGVPSVIQREPRPPAWDGLVMQAPKPNELLHELAHFQLAAPGRRHLPDFGLGPLVFGFTRSTRLGAIVTEDYAMVEEEHASLLGIAWLHALGLGWQDELVNHNWTDTQDKQPLPRVPADEEDQGRRRMRTKPKCKCQCGRVVGAIIPAVGDSSRVYPYMHLNERGLACYGTLYTYEPIYETNSKPGSSSEEE